MLSDTQVLDMSAFMRENNDEAAGRHPAYHRISASLGLTLRLKAAQELDYCIICREVAKAFCEEINPLWYKELNSEGSCITFDDYGRTSQFLQLRS